MVLRVLVLCTVGAVTGSKDGIEVQATGKSKPGALGDDRGTLVSATLGQIQGQRVESHRKTVAQVKEGHCPKVIALLLYR